MHDYYEGEVPYNFHLFFFLLLTAGPSVSRAIKCATNGVVLLPNILRCSSGWRDTYIYLSVCLSVPGWTIPWQETFFFVDWCCYGQCCCCSSSYTTKRDWGNIHIFTHKCPLANVFIFFFEVSYDSENYCLLICHLGRVILSQGKILENLLYSRMG